MSDNTSLTVPLAAHSMSLMSLFNTTASTRYRRLAATVMLLVTLGAPAYPTRGDASTPRTTSDTARVLNDFQRGVRLAERGRIDSAIRLFRQLTKDRPDWPEPYNNLAVLYARQGKFDQATQTLKTALNTHPSYVTVHNNLNRIYDQMASNAYKKAFSLTGKQASPDLRLSLLTTVAIAGRARRPTPKKPAVVKARGKTIVATTHEKPAPNVRNAEKQQILDTLRDWAQAWSRQDVEGYLSLYSPHFQPIRGVTLSTWQAQRRDRLARPRRIQVSIANPRIIQLDANRAQVRFRQTYRSDTFASSAQKVLSLTRQGDHWLIVREQVLRETSP